MKFKTTSLRSTMQNQPTSVLLAATLLASPAMATMTMDYVTVENPGNTADTTGYGAVSYTYNIGKNEVTNAQYGEFLNAAAKTDSYGLYSTSMPTYGITRSGSTGSYTYAVTAALANRPVVYVSWFDAARFSNWLGNGQQTGVGAALTAETGAYTLSGATSGIIEKNASATVYIPTEDEWYKAAYYNGANGTYSLYPNGQNTITTADANYGSIVGSSTEVGKYSGDASAYGTFDQGGNVFEWNDAVSGTSRGVRGGAWNGLAATLESSYRDLYGPTSGYRTVGFRVASVPEPSAIVLTTLFSACLITRRKR